MVRWTCAIYLERNVKVTFLVKEGEQGWTYVTVYVQIWKMCRDTTDSCVYY